jgi:sugar phosphate isomerase/epimerase
MADRSRLSLNQATVQRWSAPQAIEGCVRHGVPSIALWRNKIAETGLSACARAVRDAGLHVSSVCRGGMFPAATEAERRAKIEDNRRAVDEAASLGADSLVMVVGGCIGMPLEDARGMVADGIAALAPYAGERNVRIGLEPLHPMFCADRSVLSTTAQALAIAAPYGLNEVGVILDVFHIWWDPEIAAQITAASGRIYGFHVNDWLNPLPDTLLGRGMMGDGVIDNRKLRIMADEAGYDGPIEVEIFNQAIWDEDPDTVMARMVERFETQV